MSIKNPIFLLLVTFNLGSTLTYADAESNGTRGGGGDSIFLLGQLTGGAVAICKKMDKTLVLIQCKSNEPCDIRELCLQSDLVVSNDLEIHFPVYQMNE